MNLVEKLAAQAAERPDQPALIQTRNGVDRVLTFAQLEEQSANLAKQMTRAGVSVGDRVLLLQGMSLELYLVLLAIFRAGAVAVFIDPSAGLKNLRGGVRRVQPRALAGGLAGQFLTLAVKELRGISRKFALGRLCLPGVTRLSFKGESAPVQEVPDDHPALLTATSGSTGEPKIAVRSHGFLLAQHAALESSLDMQPGEIDLATLPIFVLANLASGLTTLLPDGDLRKPAQIDGRKIFRQLPRWQPTRTAASPAFYRKLAMDLGGTCAPHDAMRKVYTGGAPVFPPDLERIRHVFPQADPVIVYGSTEAEPIAHCKRSEILPNDEDRMRSGSGLLVGRPVPEIQLAILPDRTGESLPVFHRGPFTREMLPTEATGEIVVTGDHVLKGYLDGWGDDETKFLVHGETWHRTGDAGFLDDQGRLWLQGRCSAKIADGRGVIYPFTVECAASYCDAIRRSAFIQHAGRRLFLWEPCDYQDHPRELPAQMLTRLEFARIDEVRQVSEITVDRRHNAKIDYPRLRKMLG